MAKVRFVGSEPHTVPLVGREVQPDELVELPDAVVQEYDWPEASWEVVDSGKRLFDPSTKTAAEVNAHLAKADPDERARVLAAERDGQARKTILDNAEGV